MSRNGHKTGPTPKAPQNQPQGIPLLRTTVLHQFGWAVVPQPDGGRVLQVDTPTGERFILPFDADAALQAGHALSAPNVAVPTPGVPLN